MNGSDDSKALADDLESLRAGTLSVREFRTKYERNAAPAIGRAIWPNLEHYLSDGDIRARDPVYCAMQDAELTKLARLVRMGASDWNSRQLRFFACPEVAQANSDCT